MTIPTVLVTGAAGTLGRRLCPALEARGWAVIRPCRGPMMPKGGTGDSASATKARPLDASSTPDVMDALAHFRPQLVVGCAAYTDVAGSERWPSKAWAGNVDTARATAEACLRLRVPFLLVSSDYARAVPAPAEYIHPRWERVDDLLVYSASKRAAEDEALSRGALVARVAHLDPEKAESYTWVNGYSLANREWTEQSAERLAAFCDVFRRGNKPTALPPPGGPLRVPRFEVGPAETRTVADMVRERWPDHPALADLVTTPEEHAWRVGYAAPRDTTFARPWTGE